MPGDPARRAKEDESLELEDQNRIPLFLEIVGVYLGTLDVASMVSGSQGVLDDIDSAVSDDEKGDRRHQTGGDTGKEPDSGDRPATIPHIRA